MNKAKKEKFKKDFRKGAKKFLEKKEKERKENPNELEKNKPDPLILGNVSDEYYQDNN